MLLIATYLTHYQSYATLMMALTFFSVFLSLYEALRVTWGYRDNLRRMMRSHWQAA